MFGSLNYWKDCFSKVLGDWLLRVKILDPILFKYPPTSCCGVDLFSNLSSAGQREVVNSSLVLVQFADARRARGPEEPTTLGTGHPFMATRRINATRIRAAV